MADYIAIGDIHGLSDRLETLLDALPADGILVFLGDYIDRGPNSRAVIDRLLRLERERACVFLRGNHEDMAVRALDGDLTSMDNWLLNGGHVTLLSYEGQIPDEHRDFLSRTRPYYIGGDYIFVHAGLTPGKPPEATPPEVLYWTRNTFLRSHYDWGRLVIHGHTPTYNGLPEVLENRINIDTGAVFGGPLTAVALPEVAFIAER